MNDPQDFFERHAPSALYLHLPFCSFKCHYCDFAVRVLQSHQQIDRYLDHLSLELQALSPLAAPLHTLYIGGGTPSLLEPAQIKRLAEVLKQAFNLDRLLECTLEVNPESAKPESLKVWRELGVNRLSLGVQSFDQDLLTRCGRNHGIADIEQAVATFQNLSFDDYSLDLIYGLPEQSMVSWQNSLHSALALKPTHVSLYALEVHPQTQFGHQSLRLPDEDLAADMYEQAVEILGKSGLQHYEIANWGQADRWSQHNQVYWQNLPFLAAGVGAHGYLQQRRYGNPRSLRDYYQNCTKQDWTWQNTPQQPLSEAIEETVFLGLRLLINGLDLKAFEKRFGHPLIDFYPKVLPPLLDQGLLQQTPTSLKLSPEAVLVSNGVMAEFLEPHLPT